MTRDISLMAFAGMALVMLLTGIGIPILAALNAGLGKSLDSPLAASAILFSVGCVASVIIALVFAGMPSRAAFAQAPVASYFAAFFMLFYLIAITFIAPRIGLGNAVFFVLLGQLISATLIDHYGLLGAIRTEADVKRITGVAIMAIGVYLARKTA
ncbi:MAG: DMT family transporter [Sphingobium sp.]|jgi:transporter family-2 protein|nr:DMT family transporter [Sphingobium sp.]MCI1755938.1 DMT family transporter [Sphingobium sp.]MCI2052309.1 DMT family transporter [Sphingobium sp.]